jgi:hypothetical protein
VLLLGAEAGIGAGSNGIGGEWIQTAVVYYDWGDGRKVK